MLTKVAVVDLEIARFCAEGNHDAPLDLEATVELGKIFSGIGSDLMVGEWNHEMTIAEGVKSLRSISPSRFDHPSHDLVMDVCAVKKFCLHLHRALKDGSIVLESPHRKSA